MNRADFRDKTDVEVEIARLEAKLAGIPDADEGARPEEHHD